MDFRKHEAAPNLEVAIDLSLVSEVYVRRGFLPRREVPSAALCFLPGMQESLGDAAAIL